MNIFHRIALQGLKKNRAQTIVTVIGVVLSSAMITGVATFSVSLLDYMGRGAAEKYGGWHVAFWEADPAFATERARDDGVVETTAYENVGYAVLEGGENPNKPYLFLAGFPEAAFETLPVRLLSGRIPENSGEVLVPEHVAANGGVRLEVGDTLTLGVGRRADGESRLGQHDPFRDGETFVPQGERTYKVVGICQRPGFEEYSSPGYTLITAGDPAERGDSLSLFVTLAKPRQARTYAKDAADGAPYALNDNVLRFLGVSDDTVFLALLYAVGGILVALTVLGAVFLIYNAFSISLNERTRQFGILSSVGGTPRQLRNAVLFEGLCVGAMGIPAGILVGVGGIRLVLSAVAESFRTVAYASVPLTLTVSAPAILAAAVVSLGTILISAAVPGQKAASRPVMESIRQTDAVKIRAKAVEIPRWMERLGGLEGALALKNCKRNRSRYRSIALSLAFSIVLFVSASAFGADLKEGAKRSVMNGDGDILFVTREIEDADFLALYDRLKTAGGVTRSAFQALSTYPCRVETGELSEAFWDSYRRSAGLDGGEEAVDLSMDIQFVEDGVYQEFLESLGLPEADMEEGDNMIAVAKQNRGTDLFAGPGLDLALGAGERTKAIHAVFADTYPLDPPPAERTEVKGYVFIVVAPYRIKPQFEGLGAPTKLGMTFWSEDPEQSLADMRALIRESGIPDGYTLYNVRRIFEESRSILFVVNVFSYVFVAILALIAATNVFHTIATGVRLRRRELAMLRSVGMGEREFDKMMGLECVIHGGRALLTGLPAGGLAAWLIYRGLVAGGADIPFTFPWASMGIGAAGGMLLVFAAMLCAVHKIRREVILDALRDDMA